MLGGLSVVAKAVRGDDGGHQHQGDVVRPLGDRHALVEGGLLAGVRRPLELGTVRGDFEEAAMRGRHSTHRALRQEGDAGFPLPAHGRPPHELGVVGGKVVQTLPFEHRGGFQGLVRWARVPLGSVP